ncbi:MAG: hypothetical protein LBI28_06930 [Treponema sp.]|nr:hypothetical protein [Treponema sp.]
MRKSLSGAIETPEIPMNSVYLPFFKQSAGQNMVNIGKDRVFNIQGSSVLAIKGQI